MPSRELLEQTGFFTRGHRRFMAFDWDRSDMFMYESGLASHAASYCEFLKTIYTHPFGLIIDFHKPFGYNVIHVAIEALKNGMDHVHNPRGRVSHVVYLGKDGLCQGFHDKGDYFKRPEVKTQYESKTKITKDQLDLRFEEGFRIGVNDHIFPMSDQIEVDTNEGVLYTLHLIRPGDMEPFVLGQTQVKRE